MKAKNDAFGNAFLDYLKGIRSNIIVERDDGYIDAGGIETYLTAFRYWSKDLKNAMKYVRGKVLDIGCGAGRHALYLQKKGFDVLGIDISPLAVKVCKKRGLKKARVMGINKVSKRLGVFETILMLGNNFGLFANKTQAQRLLKRFYGMTTHDARIIAQSRNPYKTQDPCHLHYHNYNRRKGRMPGQIRLRVRYKTYAEPWYDYLLVSPREMVEILKNSQWKVDKFIEPKANIFCAVMKKKSPI